MRKTVCVLVVVMATQIYQFVNFILKKEGGNGGGRERVDGRMGRDSSMIGR